MTRLRTTALAVAASAAGAAVLLTPSPAHAAAGTLFTSGPHLFYIAAAGQMNALVISRTTVTVAEVYEFNDEVAISSTDTACMYPDPADTTRMWCAVGGAVDVDVNAMDSNDTVVNQTVLNAYLDGGSGNDTLTLGGHTGGAGSASGGDGNDVIKSGEGNDTIVGGPGTDTVSYAGTNSAVTAYLSLGTGGRSYENDAYSGIESLTGGGGDDRLYGDANTNGLDGGTGWCVPRGCVPPSGNDALRGYGGLDVLTGRSGLDDIYGGDGTDFVNGGEDGDYIRGETGDDVLNGGAGVDLVYGGPGYDQCMDDDGNGWYLECEALT
jgi:Ca2+-binding RTX toxin-like protein